MKTGSGLVDVHTHAIPADLDEPLSEHKGWAWPSVRRVDERTARIYLGGVPYRTIDDRCWSVERRLADMDAEGVAIQVLSPVPITLCHDAPADGAARLAGAMNDFLAGMVQTDPHRFRALGAVPLQDPEAAIDEMYRCMAAGFVGVEIGTRVGDRELSDPHFDEFFAAAAAMSALVLVHPVDTMIDPRARDLGIAFGAGMPAETGAAAAGWLVSGALTRRPAVRLCLAHGGGSLPWLLPRLDVGVQLADENHPDQLLPSTLARMFYSDSLTYDAGSLQLSVDRFGAGHVLLGTDYPFAARESPAGAVLTDPGLDDELRHAIGVNNAQTVFELQRPPIGRGAVR